MGAANDARVLIDRRLRFRHWQTPRVESQASDSGKSGAGPRFIMLFPIPTVTPIPSKSVVYTANLNRPEDGRLSSSV